MYFASFRSLLCVVHLPAHSSSAFVAAVPRSVTSYSSNIATPDSSHKSIHPLRTMYLRLFQPDPSFYLYSLNNLRAAFFSPLVGLYSFLQAMFPLIISMAGLLYQSGASCTIAV